jgi:hypothetical protein
MQINWLINSSSLLNKIASTFDTDPVALLKNPAGRRMSKRVQERERDRLVEMIRKAVESSKVMLSMVQSIIN